jgi:hypothetical protein
VKRGDVDLFCPPLLFFPDQSVFFSHPTTFHPNSDENSKTFRFPSWKRLHGMICRRRESIDAYSPIDALGTKNRLPFRSRHKSIPHKDPLSDCNYK